MTTWKQLLTPKRLGAKEPAKYSQIRNPFQQDFDRIVFSASFRRLQDKTQVFPLAATDYVRTRLTHSLESSSVGRSLGTMVGEKVLKRDPGLNKLFLASDFGDIVAAACLAHDIGNPPFGHTGEAAIAHWFRTSDYGQEVIARLRQENAPAEEFLAFEGNAQGFRIVTRLEHRNRIGGMQLTCPTLAAFIKYPRSVLSPKHKEKHVADKKHGFFRADREVFLEIAETVGLIPYSEAGNGYLPLGRENLWFARHPLAWLVEAADDLCYHVIDIEDGFRQKLLGFDETRELLASVLTKPLVEKGMEGVDPTSRIEFLRAKAIGDIIGQTVEVFDRRHDQILDGSLAQPLTSLIEKHAAFDQLLETAITKVYQSHDVVRIEAAGFTVLGKLIETFLQALEEKAAGGNVSIHTRVILNLFPSEPFGANADGAAKASVYERVLATTDYVSSLTDRSAVSLFRQLTGMSLSSND
jgi:dGTPase